MRYLVGPTAFVLSILTSAALTFVMTPVPDPPLPPPASLQPEPRPAYDVVPHVIATQIALYRDRKVVFATIRLAPDQRPERVGRIWVVFAFEAPGRQDTTLWTKPVALDFSDGRDAVAVAAPAPWVGGSEDPGSGYFAELLFSGCVPSTVWLSDSASDSGEAVRYPVVVCDERKYR